MVKEVNTMRGIPKENLVHIMVSVKATAKIGGLLSDVVSSLIYNNNSVLLQLDAVILLLNVHGLEIFNHFTNY